MNSGSVHTLAGWRDAPTNFTHHYYHHYYHLSLLEPTRSPYNHPPPYNHSSYYYYHHHYHYHLHTTIHPQPTGHPCLPSPTTDPHPVINSEYTPSLDVHRQNFIVSPNTF
jgi:hypothetical protein